MRDYARHAWWMLETGDDCTPPARDVPRREDARRWAEVAYGGGAGIGLFTVRRQPARTSGAEPWFGSHTGRGSPASRARSRALARALGRVARASPSDVEAGRRRVEGGVGRARGLEADPRVVVRVVRVDLNRVEAGLLERLLHAQGVVLEDVRLRRLERPLSPAGQRLLEPLRVEVQHRDHAARTQRAVGLAHARRGRDGGKLVRDEGHGDEVGREGAVDLLSVAVDKLDGHVLGLGVVVGHCQKVRAEVDADGLLEGRDPADGLDR
mmetsp:Transcript_26359/g.45050  ORF Transcript_26359/g.45050 Transcript_26359/m.45050 type:complete len:267 (+) Transcript_26359:117-917(+)